MAAIAAEKFFEKLELGRIDSFVLIQGENPYLEKEMRALLKKQGFDIYREDLKSASPQPQLEDQALSASLFQPRRCLWVQSKNTPDKWSKDGQKIWSRIQESADGEALLLLLQVAQVSSAKKKSKEIESDALTVNFSELRIPFWLERMNQSRQPKLEKNKIQYLLDLDLDLMAAENSIELWSLGGDAWARDTLGWGMDLSATPSVGMGSNPSFAWVDAVLEGREAEAARLAKVLSESGSEFLLLVGLLAKSLKIWAMLEEGRNDSSQPPFLLSKIQKVRKIWSQKEGNSIAALNRIVEWTANSDLWIKSRPVDEENLLLRISESARHK